MPGIVFVAVDTLVLTKIHTRRVSRAKVATFIKGINSKKGYNDNGEQKFEIKRLNGDI